MSAALSAAGCGARTGLRVPCAVELEALRPAVVLIAYRGADMNRAPDGYWPDHLQTETYSAAAPLLDRVATVGGIDDPPTADWQLNHANRPYCILDPIELNEPLAEGGATRWANRLLGFYTNVETSDTHSTNHFRVPVDAAARALRGITDRDRPRYLVLTRNDSECGGPFAESWQQHVDLVRELREQDGIRTMVLEAAYLPVSAGSDVYVRAHLEALAAAGGFSREYFYSNDPGPVLRAMEEQLGGDYYCRLRVGEGYLPGDRLRLHLSDGRVLPSSDAAPEPWEWEVPGRILRVTGAACSLLRAEPGPPSATALQRSCWL